MDTCAAVRQHLARGALLSEESSPSHGAPTPLPFSHAYTRRYLQNLQISGTIPIDVGQMTKLDKMFVSLSLLFPCFPAPRPRAAAPPRAGCSLSAGGKSPRALHARRLLTALSPLALFPRAHSQVLVCQQDQRHRSRRIRPAHEA